MARVLVIGSAHLDVIGEYQDIRYVDRKGKVTYSIGGTAYNIAVDLAQHRIRCFLFTYLKKNSILSRIIWNKLALRGVKRRYVRSVTTICGDAADPLPLAESGFVAHRDSNSKDISAAVTRTGITDVTLSQPHGQKDLKRLRRAIRQARCVVADCNLSTALLEKIIEYARQRHKMIVVPVVSDSKASHLISLEKADRLKVDLVTGNVEEVLIALDEYRTAKEQLAFDQPVRDKRALADQVIRAITRDKVARQLCAAFNTRMVSASWGDEKCLLLTEAGDAREIPGPAVPANEVVTRTGAGDAWTAAWAHTIFDLRDLPPLADPPVPRCHDYLRIILSQEGATPGATLQLDADEQVPRRHFFGRIIGFFRHNVVYVVIEHAWGALLLAGVGAAVVLALQYATTQFNLPEWAQWAVRYIGEALHHL